MFQPTRIQGKRVLVFKKVPGTFPATLCLGIMVLLLALGYAWSRIHVVELGYEVTQLRKVVEQVSQENGVLKSKLAGSVAHGHLLPLVKQYGMKPPESRNIYFISEPKE